MLEVQKFAVEKIYCAPSQDRQFSFSLARVTKPNFPLKRFITVYNVNKALPDTTNAYHVFVLGNLNPSFLNLLKQYRNWFKDVWCNAQDDMNTRNFIMQLYNEQGVMFPRAHVFYSFIDENSIIFAIRCTESIQRYFDVNSFKYLRVYSNAYFNSIEFASLPTKLGIMCDLALVTTNNDKVALQTKIKNYEKNGGKTLVYVNGYHTDNLNLNIPDNSYIEILYDQSILSKEKFPISSLRTFESTRDNKLKYLVFRDKIVDTIQYDDDNEIYISTPNGLVTKGLFFYEHRDYAVRNVTDKDYSLYTSFVNNQAATLSTLTTGSVSDKVVVLYTRKSNLNKKLIYSAAKFHELYKLPQDVELDVLSNTNYTITELRAETLENSDYFRLAGAPKLKEITKELATSALGYNGVTYYFGNSPVVLDTTERNINVPLLYHKQSYAFEYDHTGKLTGQFVTNGPLYTASSPQTKYVEFLKGTTPNHFGSYLAPDAVHTLRDAEYRILSAYFNDITRMSNWEDITDNANVCTIVGNTLTLNEQSGKKIKIVYLDEPLVYNLDLPIVDGVLHFPLAIEEDRGTGIQNHTIDLPYRSVEVFVNGKKCNYELDFFASLPYITICNKTYLDYTKETQSIHIRLHGYTLDKADINKQEIRGFVNNGVLTRNKYYDIRDDRVFSIFVGGTLRNRKWVHYAEDDNVVRLTHPLNGVPYVMSESLIPVKEVTGLPTLPLFEKNAKMNDRVSNLFNQIFKEPTINEFNLIGQKHYIYSPTVSKIIHDLLDGNIPATLYTTPYDDSTILQLIDGKYKTLFLTDPIKYLKQDNIVEIHPHIGNATVAVNLFQYRFLTNVVRVITQNNPARINLSGYILMQT